MSLSVIGAGFSRTGTTSLKLALEQLGFGPCYHGEEHTLASPRTPFLWERALDHQSIDWDEVFAGYRATTDLPGCLFYRQLAEKYPSAKVILTLRESNAWFDSFQAIPSPAHAAPYKQFPTWPMQEKARATAFGDRINDRGSVIAAYERHNAEVRVSIPADRLLVYDVKQGWEPLCEFLGVPIPETPYPKVNTKTDHPQDPSLIRGLLTEIHAGRLVHVRDADVTRARVGSQGITPADEMILARIWRGHAVRTG